MLLSSLNMFMFLTLVVDGVPKEGLRIGDVLCRIAVLMQMQQRVSL